MKLPESGVLVSKTGAGRVDAAAMLNFSKWPTASSLTSRGAAVAPMNWPPNCHQVPRTSKPTRQSATTVGIGLNSNYHRSRRHKAKNVHEVPANAPLPSPATFGRARVTECLKAMISLVLGVGRILLGFDTRFSDTNHHLSLPSKFALSGRLSGSA